MLREVVPGQRRQVPIVHLPIRQRRHPGIMRCREGDICEERFVAIVTSKEFDHGIREQLAGRLLARANLGQLAVGAKVPDRHLGVIRHAAEEDVLSLLEGPQPGRLTVVPLACAERDVAVLLKDLRQQPGILDRDGVHMEPGLAAHQHCPAGHADGAAIAPKTVIGPKAEARDRQPVYVWSPNARITMGRDGVGTLVIREKEQDIGLSGSVGQGTGARQGQQKTQDPWSAVSPLHFFPFRFPFSVAFCPCALSWFACSKARSSCEGRASLN